MAGMDKIPEGSRPVPHEIKVEGKKSKDIDIKGPSADDLPKNSGIESAPSLQLVFSKDGKDKIDMLLREHGQKDPKLDMFYLYWMLYSPESDSDTIGEKAANVMTKLLKNMISRS